jgi:hypothetical protein
MTKAQTHHTKTRNPWPWRIVGLLVLFLGFTFWPGLDSDIPYNSTLAIDRPGRDLGLHPESEPVSTSAPLLPDLIEENALNTPVEGIAVVNEFVGEQGVWLTTPETDARLLVVLDQNVNKPELRIGQQVKIQGMVYHTSHPSPVATQQLEEDTQDALAGEKLFVHVGRIETVPNS